MSLSDDIFNIDGDERQAVFEELYFFKFGRLAHPGREAVRKETMEKIKIIKELGKEVTDFLAEHGGDAAKKALKTGSDAVIANMVNNLVAREVVKGTVKGAVDQFGRRGAVFAIEQGENMTAAQGAHAAVNGIKVAGKIGAFIPGISAAIGQPIAEKCTEFAGIENHHAKNCLDVVRSCRRWCWRRCYNRGFTWSGCRRCRWCWRVVNWQRYRCHCCDIAWSK